MPPIPGVTVEEICSAFEEAFDKVDLREMLKKRLSLNLASLSGAERWGTIVLDVFEWFERRGRTTDLIRTGYEFNPTHPAMRAIYDKYGLTGVILQKGGTATEPVKPAEGGFEKTIKNRLPQLDFSVWRTQMTQVEGRVCRVEINGNPAGTGFLVGPDAVLTNYHVLESVLTGDTPATKVACRFDYKLLAEKSKVEGLVVPLHPTEWSLDNSPYSPAEKTRTPDTPPPTGDQLDYALVRLAERVGEKAFTPKGGAEAQTRGWLSLPTTPTAFTKDMPLMIVQHPDGGPLKLAVDTESVIGEVADGLRVRYRTNTEPGSSGAPVFDLTWNLVALHHLGDPAADLPPTYNQGIPLNKIRDRVAKTCVASLG
ncbi:trypsin-like peptidase domain-containing protein [bacterium]|nr:trypsin-like peptidase domain-containing protein [bacterium]